MWVGLIKIEINMISVKMMIVISRGTTHKEKKIILKYMRPKLADVGNHTSECLSALIFVGILLNLYHTWHTRR